MTVTPSESRALSPWPNGGNGAGFFQPSSFRAVKYVLKPIIPRATTTRTRFNLCNSSSR